MIVGSNSRQILVCGDHISTVPDFLLVGTIQDFEALHKQLAAYLGRGKYTHDVVSAPDGTFTFMVTKESVAK